MKPMRVLIVDDEDLARAVLRELLAAHPEVEIVGEAANGFAAVKLAEELAPDLLFLDIQMPKLSGFEVMELLGEKVAVIFVTAYDEFALKAFDVHAVDYLLKPVEPARLGEAIERAAARLAQEQAQTSGVSTRPSAAAIAAAAQPPGRPIERVLIREEGRVHVLPLGKIDFIEAKDDYLSFAVAGKRLQKQQTMGELEAQLDGSRFVRVHRSYLLNIERLARLELYAKDSWIAILADGTRIPVSRTGHARLKELLG
jgi:two-component system LytT family response regulator